jgi:hypothetical protein
MFVVKNRDHAKRIAARLKEKLQAFGYDISFVQSLNMVARMYGHSNWNALEAACGRDAASLFDEDAAMPEVIERRQLQLSTLRQFGVKETALPRIVDAVRPTARPWIHDPEQIDSETTSEVLEIAQRRVLDGDTIEAAKNLAYAISNCPKSDRPTVFAALEHLAVVDHAACYNLGMAYLIGDAPDGKDLAKAREAMERCVAFQTGDEFAANALCVLGDIAGGNHGGPRDDDLAVKYYRTSALTGVSPNGAFNTGLHYASRELYEIAGAFYFMGAKLLHVGCITNYAMMVADGRIEGNERLVETFLTAAAELGDVKAANALRNLDMLFNRRADSLMPPVMREMLQQYRPPLIIRIMPIRAWLKILNSHGWSLENVRTALTEELDCFATTRAADGTRFNLHACIGMHVAGQASDRYVEDYHRRFGDDPGIIIYNKITPLSEGDDPKMAHLCIGRLHLDGEWSDVFLEMGGIDAVIVQRRAQQAKSQMDRSQIFYCPDADTIAADLARATERAIDRYARDY